MPAIESPLFFVKAKQDHCDAYRCSCHKKNQLETAVGQMKNPNYSSTRKKEGEKCDSMCVCLSKNKLWASSVFILLNENAIR